MSKFICFLILSLVIFCPVAFQANADDVINLELAKSYFVKITSFELSSTTIEPGEKITIDFSFSGKSPVPSFSILLLKSGENPLQERSLFSKSYYEGVNNNQIVGHAVITIPPTTQPGQYYITGQAFTTCVHDGELLCKDRKEILLNVQ